MSEMMSGTREVHLVRWMGASIRKSMAVALAGGLALAVSAGSGCQRGGAGGAGGFAPPPMPVEAARVVQGSVADVFEAVGTIEAGESITVVAEIAASVTALPFAEGQFIPAGGLIAQLDDAQLKAEVARAEALVDQNRIIYGRVKAIVDQRAGAPQDLDNAAADLKVAEADLALTKARLAKTRITAPWAGVLGPRRVSPGAFLRPGDPITELAAIAEIKVEFSAPERYAGLLKRGAEVTVSTPAYPDYKLTGRIDVIDPVLDPVLRNAQLIARVKNPHGRLRPGMSANISAVLGRRDSALTIPNEAIFAEGDKNFVFAIKPDSTVTRVALSLGTRLPAQVEVLAGLEPGMQVVRTGHQKLFEGAKVVPVSAAPAPGSPAVSAGDTSGGATE
jgi:membrane fusion protein (multidrug efflux system)